jgi:superfamily I DNA/RNA helicase/mRNA-degrading endonuclease RelE of RelBE toxin-antitoxin system
MGGNSKYTFEQAGRFFQGRNYIRSEMSKREINIKPSCMNEIRAFPTASVGQLWEKINFLVENPIPDGHLKKKIRASDNLYRLRVGDYRVFYTFGDTWVRLLGIRIRDEHTYQTAHIDADKPISEISQENEDFDLIQDTELKEKPFRFDPKPQQRTLPRHITEEWLKELDVPPGFFPILISCDSEDALLSAKIPAAILEKIVDNLFPRPLEEVQKQPDLMVRTTEDLIRFREGDLVAFLLKLDEEQVRLTQWALKGPTMLKGGAGTGKSTVALYRIKALLERPGPTEQEQILFVTYTRALMAASRQLLGQLLTAEQLKCVRVATCDEIAREIVESKRHVKHLESGGELISLLHQVRASFTPAGPSSFDRNLRTRMLNALPDKYLLEEFEWIIDGRGLQTLEVYKATPRPGRILAFREGLRAAVWELHSVFVEQAAKKGIERFSSIRTEALDMVRNNKWKPRYNYVLVDEAQDLTPQALRLITDICRSPEGIFLAADNKQSIYSRSYNWSTAHPSLQFKGRTATLGWNYRSTEEIDKAAFDVLDSQPDQELEPSKSMHSGPIPILLRGVKEQDEALWASRFIRQMCLHLRMKLSGATVLVPGQPVGERIAAGLCTEGINARFIAGRELNLREDVVKVMTLHSAKGLEFPVVVISGFEPGTYPVESDFATIEEFQERISHQRRLLYVGMTRAMRGLMVISPADCLHKVLLGLKLENWHVEDVA